MRIAWVVAYPVFGGPHNHIGRIAPHLRTLGVQTCVVVPEEVGNAFERLDQAPDLDVVALPLHRLRATRETRPHVDLVRTFIPETGRLAKLFRERDIDVVVQATLLPPHASVAARRAGLPLVCQVVDTRPPRPVAAVGMEIVRHLADRVMFCGDRLVELHTGQRPLGVPMEVFRPPVDTTRFAPSTARREATRAAWEIPLDASVVGMVGNLNPQKGWEYFVRAAGIIHREVRDAYFLMVGATYDLHQGYLALIEREIGASGVPRERFIMTGESREVETLLAAMDIKLITSVLRSEGTPTTGLEALACGVPLVGVDVGAVAEFVLDGETGFLVQPLDPASIANAAVRLLRDAELRARMGANGRELAVRCFDVRASAKQHELAFSAAQRHHAGRAGRRHAQS